MTRKDQTSSGTAPEAAPLGWGMVLLIMLGCHATSTLLLRLAPTIAPAIVDQYGWSPSFVGWIATAANLGSIVVVAAGVGVFKLLGSVRSLRLGLAAGALGTLILIVPLPWLALLGAFIVGLGHGPTNPAGNDILQRYVPAGKQGLIFSIKQSSVPVAGMAGGLALPGIAQACGVEGALIVGAVIGGLTILATAPVRRREQRPVPRGQWRRALSRDHVLAPLRCVLGSPSLRSLAISGGLLAFVQSVWFVYLTSYLAFGLGYSATQAGILYALTQGSSILGRLCLGYLADRLGSGQPLILGSLVLSTLSTLALAALVHVGPGPWVVAVCLLGGIGAAGWNGIQVSETVRHAGKGQIYEAVSGVTLAIGSGVVSGPLAVSMMLDLGMGWGAILSVLALLPVLGWSATLAEMRRETARGIRAGQ
ncbi:MAG: MFS transporter [Qingshengfaniella sp.]